jgi:hypothetical protein
VHSATHEAHLAELFVQGMGMGAPAAATAASEAVGVERSLVQAWSGTVHTTFGDYFAAGEFAADTMPFTGLEALVPALDLRALMRAVGGPSLEAAVVARDAWVFRPVYFTRLHTLLSATVPAAHWRSYLRASVLEGSFWTMPRTFTTAHLGPAPARVHGSTPSYRQHRHNNRIMSLGDLTLPWIKRRAGTGSEWVDGGGDEETERGTNTRTTGRGVAQLTFNPYPLPSDDSLGAYHDVCRGHAQNHLWELYDRWFLNLAMPPADRARIEGIVAQVRTHAIATLGASTWLDGSPAADRARIIQKLQNIHVQVPYKTPPQPHHAQRSAAQPAMTLAVPTLHEALWVWCACLAVIGLAVWCFCVVFVWAADTIEKMTDAQIRRMWVRFGWGALAMVCVTCPPDLAAELIARARAIANA